MLSCSYPDNPAYFWVGGAYALPAEFPHLAMLIDLVKECDGKLSVLLLGYGKTLILFLIVRALTQAQISRPKPCIPVSSRREWML
jgi:hypothetical protein